MILDQIVENVRNRLEAQKKALPLDKLQEMAVRDRPAFAFRSALEQPGIQVISEIKKASPSAGVIAPDFDPIRIAHEYEAAGVAAISVITEPDFFQGSLEYLINVRKTVSLPLLRKDFIIDPYQIYQAKQAGADCVLLITAILSRDMITEFLGIATELQLDALVEVHNESELEAALQTDANIIGINNRDLTTFSVDLNTSFYLKKMIPDNKITVSESGIKTQDHVAALEAAGFDAMLIGERFMRSEDKPGMIRELLGTN